MADQVVFGDLEAWLISEIRTRLAGHVPTGWTVKVTNRVAPSPADYPAGLLVLVHDDGGVRDLVTRDCTVRIRVIAPATGDGDGALTGDAARYIDLVLAGSARVENGNPVSAFLGSQGAVRVANTDSDRAEYLIIAQLRIAGTQSA